MNTAMTLPGGAPDPELFSQHTPGVEVVREDPRNNAVLGPAVLRLIGALHRRLLPKFTVARREPVVMAGRWGNSRIDADRGVARVIDLPSTSVSVWSDRVEAYSSMATGDVDGTTALRVRGLHDNEPAILVDGRPVPGCIVDLAVGATTFVDELREGQRSLLIVHPDANGACQAELWALLLQLCQDRLGIDRGTLRALPGVLAATETHARS